MSMQIADDCCHSRTVYPARSEEVSLSVGGAHNLFRSSYGIGLPVEVCLEIVEDVLDVEPRCVGALMCLSKVCCAFSSSKLYCE